MHRAIAAAALLLTAGQAAAQDLVPPEGALPTHAQQAATESFDLPTGSYAAPDHERALTGGMTRQAWRIDGEDSTAAGALGHYEAKLTALGYTPLFRCRNDGCGGFDFRFGADILPAPAMVIDVADFAQLTMEADGGRFASVLASRALGAVWVQLVLIDTSGVTAETADPAPPPEGPLVEPGEILPEDTGADDIAATLREEGHVAIRGLVFSTGGASLSDGSAEALDRLARALTENDTLDVAIVGHTDAVGSFDGNLTLSRQRAEAVRAALIERGVAAGRLEAQGVAYLAPLATNRTEDGRRLNRRVELVLK